MRRDMNRCRPRLAGLALGAVLAWAAPARGLEPALLYFTPDRELSVYDGLNGWLVGTNGFQITGAAGEERLGSSIAWAGDFNGDGYDDLALGAPLADLGSNFRAGRVGVVYGGRNMLPTQPASFLNGANGFRANGAAADDRAGSAVTAAGDVNGDGLADLLIGAPQADPEGRADAGCAYVLLGSAHAPLNVELADLDGTNGFTLVGEAADYRCGAAVAGAGDVNGDGLADLLVGAENASPGGQTDCGRVYLVYGATARVARIDLGALNGTNGMVLTGEDAYDGTGHAVAGLGDFNGDRLADLLIGAYNAPDFWSPGRAYVVFGSTNRAAALSLSMLNGTNGVVLLGTGSFGQAGSAVAGADLNGDGRADAVVGAPNLDRCYVIFGTTGRVAAVTLAALNGTNGFILTHTNAAVGFGAALACAPRLNGDGLDDLLCGAPLAGSNELAGAGAIWALCGAAAWPAVTDVGLADGTNGFRVRGLQAGAEAGGALDGAGDFNRDGFSDVALGAALLDCEAVTNGGAAYVLAMPGAAEFVLARPEFTGGTVAGAGVRWRWQGQAGVLYTVYTNTALAAGGWSPAASWRATNDVGEWSHVPGSAGALFYRLGARR